MPKEILEAATIDGAGMWRIFRSVVLPVSAPAFVVTLIWQFTSAWNDFLFALSLTSTNSARTVPAALTYFTGATTFEKPVAAVAAAAVVITIPVVIFVLFFQRRIVAGLTSGAVKG